MKNPLKELIVQLLKKTYLYGPYRAWKTGPLKSDGWLRSFKEDRSVDGSGQPLPWITYPAIDFLKKRIRPDMVVFEYGCGFSSLWWASRVSAVVSVEHDRTWYEKMKAAVPKNVNINHVVLEYGGAYSKKILEYDAAFDIVLIDGRDRVNCARNSIKALKPGGVIVWDNSDREEYEPGMRFLLEHDFRRIEFTGLAPLIDYKSETSVFYRQDNCLGI